MGRIALAAAALSAAQWFRFTVRPGRRAEVWRYAGGAACMLTVTVRAPGLVRLELRGY